MKKCRAWCGVWVVPVVVLGGLWLARRDLTRPNLVLPTQMSVSPAYKTQSACAVLPKGMTNQAPVEGTLPRGAQGFHYGTSDAERQRAGKELINPIPCNETTREHGKQLYERFCLVCHGATGHGDGPIIPKFPNPPDFHSEQAKKLPDGAMFHTITLGRNKMASYASQLSWQERWEVICYIRALQEGGRSSK